MNEEEQELENVIKLVLKDYFKNNVIDMFSYKLKNRKLTSYALFKEYLRTTHKENQTILRRKIHNSNVLESWRNKN